MKEESIELVDNADVDVYENTTDKIGKLLYGYRSRKTGKYFIDNLIGYWKMTSTSNINEFLEPSGTSWDTYPSDSKNEKLANFNDVFPRMGSDYLVKNTSFEVRDNVYNTYNITRGGAIFTYKKQLTSFPVRIGGFYWDDMERMGNNGAQKGYRVFGIRRRIFVGNDTVMAVNHRHKEITLSNSYDTDELKGHVILHDGYLWHIVSNTGNTAVLKHTTGLKANDAIGLYKYENEVTLGIYEGVDIEKYCYKIQSVNAKKYVDNFYEDVQSSDVKRKIGWRMFEVVYNPDEMKVSMYIDGKVIVTEQYNLFGNNTSDMEMFIEGGVFEGLVTEDIDKLYGRPEDETGNDYMILMQGFSKIGDAAKYRLTLNSVTLRDGAGSSEVAAYPDATHPLILAIFDRFAESWGPISAYYTDGVNDIEITKGGYKVMFEGDKFYWMKLDETDYADISKFTVLPNEEVTSENVNEELRTYLVLVNDDGDYLLRRILSIEGFDDGGVTKYKNVILDDNEPIPTGWGNGYYTNWYLVQSSFYHKAEATRTFYRGRIASLEDNQVEVYCPVPRLIWVRLKNKHDVFNEDNVGALKSLSWTLERYDEDENKYVKVLDGEFDKNKYDKMIYGTGFNFPEEEYAYLEREGWPEQADGYDGDNNIIVHLYDENNNYYTVDYSPDTTAGTNRTEISPAKMMSVKRIQVFRESGITNFDDMVVRGLLRKDNTSPYTGMERQEIYSIFDTAVLEGSYETPSVPFVTLNLLPQNLGSESVGKYKSLTVNGLNLSDLNYLKVSIFKSDGSSIGTDFEDIIVSSNREIDISNIDIGALGVDTRIKVRVEFISDGYDTPYLDSIILKYYIAPRITSLVASDLSVNAGERVLFTAESLHSDLNNEVKYYQFDFGDGVVSDWVESNKIIHIYTKINTAGYQVKVRCKDNEDIVSKWFIMGDLVVVNNGAPVARAYVKPVIGYTTTVFTVDASMSYDINTHDIESQDGIKEYRYNFGDGVDTDWITNETYTHTYSTVGEYEISVKVRDYEGVEDEYKIQVNVIETPVPEELILHNIPEKISMDNDKDYNLSDMLNLDYKEVDISVAGNKTSVLSGVAYGAEGLEDIKVLEDAYNEGKLVKIKYRDVAKLGYDLPNPEGDKYIIGYIVSFSQSKEGGNKKMIPWKLTIVEVDMRQFGGA